MSKAYRDLEILVAKIQQQLAPNAEVVHDVKLDGHRSKTKRQIDILVREKIAQYEINVTIDCNEIGIMPSHPDAIMREEILAPRGLNVTRAGKALDVCNATLSDLLNDEGSPFPPKWRFASRMPSASIWRCCCAFRPRGTSAPRGSVKATYMFRALSQTSSHHDLRKHFRPFL